MSENNYEREPQVVTGLCTEVAHLLKFIGYLPEGYGLECFDGWDYTIVKKSLVTKQLLGNVSKTFQNGWIFAEMLNFLLVIFRFFLMEFQLVFIHQINN